jgi:NADPH-dependent glutamate synthase beta subunit-like oxidoreductase
MTTYSGYYIAIIGGSVAGSEAAHQLAQQGAKVAVFDQLALPYGKIEDGLPKWHVKLRDKEESAIDEKLQHPNIRFIPKSKLGKEIDLNELIDDWKFTAVILAIGAWRDRPLELPGIEDFISKNLIYQNKLIKWFNHYHESDYKGINIDLPDGVAVIGGGLSSIDVIKIVQIYTVQKALKKKGIEEDIFSLERGIDKVLEKHQLTMKDLGLKGATLFYRKRAKDMPLKPYSDESQKEKAQEVSERMLNITKDRYLFNYQPNSVAVGTLVRKGKFDGLIFQKTLVEDGRSIAIEGSEFEFYTTMVISSIGSLPEHIAGLPSKNDLILSHSDESCRVANFKNVFAIGNAVTGRGNIKESRAHGRESAERILDRHLDPKKEQYQAFLRNLESKVDQQVQLIQQNLTEFIPLASENIKLIDDKISALQQKVDYNEDYFSWKESHLWERLEHTMDSKEEAK